MCSIDSYESENQSYICYDGSSGGGCPLQTNSTIEALDSLGVTIDFIDCWLKALENIFIERCNFYSHNMDLLFRKSQLNFLNNPVKRKN